MNKQFLYISAITAILIAILLTIVQIVPNKPLLLLDRFVPSAGWIQVGIAVIYGALLSYKMQDRKERPKWRLRAWLLFSIVFFGQLFLGITVDSVFLMTGKLHLPVPAIILAGPLFRLEGLFMPILFMSTLLLSGPAWCSQLCYFGAFDAWNAKGKTEKNVFHYHKQLRYSVFFIVIAGAIALRLFGATGWLATIAGLIVGIIGLGIMLTLSRKKKKMIHCSSYCPIGTLVSFMKKLSPFRVRLNMNCTHCMACLKACKYDALHKENIEKGKIGYTCTYCGDCLSACKHGGLEYRFLRLRPATAERLWIVITVVLHTCFLMIARI
ncbi:4Fe-4S binding protein [Parabacteroides faecis]|uniref:4Fe-4S binding protein n=1 Tax=Parabacteroides faecis TaxID=1217282 RepID=UPI003521AF9D